MKMTWREMLPLLFDLAARFPGVFVVQDARRRPLKVGIHLDAIAAAPDLDVKLLKATLSWYTTSDGYFLKTKEGATRVDLTGAPAGSVSAEDAEHARSRLQEKRQRKAEKKKARKSVAAASPAAVPAPVPAQPTRLSLSGLRMAARMRSGRSGKAA
jgi:ProP effector